MTEINTTKGARRTKRKGAKTRRETQDDTAELLREQEETRKRHETLQQTGQD
jgi:hypothetical protein